MLIYLIINRKEVEKNKKAYPIPGDFIKLFVLFIFLTAFALLLNGEFFDYGFLKLLLSRYLPCIVAFFAFDHFLSTPARCKQTVIFLSVFIVINCIITIFQFTGNPLGLKIALLLTNVAENENNIINNGGRSDMVVFGVNSAVGLFQYTFSNAMYIGSLGLLLAGIMSEEKRFLKPLLFFLIFIVIFACMTTQGRSPYLMMVLMFLILFLRSSVSKTIKAIGVAIVVIAAFTYIPQITEAEAIGRITNQDIYKEDVRQDIWRGALSFIQNHLLLGGPYSYFQTGADPPHNYFLNALVMSGLFGGLVATALYIKVMFESIIVFLKKDSSMLLLSAAAAIISYQANSLFHNASIITADTMFFLIYPLYYKIKLMKI